MFCELVFSVWMRWLWLYRWIVVILGVLVYELLLFGRWLVMRWML